MDSLPAGFKFGTRYTILKKLGAGGMGTVYQAWDESLSLPVALKLIRLDQGVGNYDLGALEARFKRELLLARQVTHPNVVRIHDLGELGTTKYLTMAYVDGADLATVVRREGRLPVHRAVTIIKQVADGLSAAHRIGIVHRDLKPANVMVNTDGQALLTDFGIARSVDASSMHTATGSLVGTLEYMSPEQVRGASADRRTDVYALGLILYEMLAGGRPMAAANGGLADLLARVEKGPPPLSSVAADVPAALERIVDRCLERDPEDRYPSAAELVVDLESIAPDGSAVVTVTDSRERPEPERRSWWQPALIVVVLAIAAASAWWLVKSRAATTGPAAAPDPVSVLIADFENRSGDPVFNGAIEQALSLGLEGAPFIRSHSRAEAAKLGASLRPGAPLDPTTAHLVAVREEIRVVVAGSISPNGNGYRLEARALKPATGETFATAAAVASDKAGVLGAVAGLARDLRSALGDTTPPDALRAESFSAGSLEAVRAYTIAQELSTNRKNEAAIEYYKQAVQHDPNFGRAYSGWAVSARDLGRRAEAEEMWKKALSLLDRMTDRERYRTLGAYYIGVAGNYEQAIEAYRNLVDRYPADLAGHNNLALAYFYTMNFPKALEYGRRAIEVYPDSMKFRNNYALYAMYAGDFKTAKENAEQVLTKDAHYDGAFLPIAMASLVDGDVAAARAAYERARRASASGASLAAAGLADAAMFQGRAGEAVALLKAAIPVDRAAGNTQGVAIKLIALAEALTATEGPAAGLRVLEPLLQDPFDQTLAVPAARLFSARKQRERTLALATTLDGRGQPIPKAYAGIITGELALYERRYSVAIEQFSSAMKSADLWLARLNLGIAYVEAGRYAEAISELEIAARRRGEATSLFFDDTPTYRYAVVLPYWLGRAQQGLNMASAAGSFERFLQIRSAAEGDPLVADARKRLDALRGR